MNDTQPAMSRSYWAVSAAVVGVSTDPKTVVSMTAGPTCGLAATVEGRFGLRGAGEPVGRVRISCIEGHGWLLLADRVRPVTLGGDLDALEAPAEPGLTG